MIFQLTGREDAGRPAGVDWIDGVFVR